MDDHISLQVIDEPIVKDININTNEETLEDDNSDLQNFLKTWVSVEMNPDKLNIEEDSFEAQQQNCYAEARHHIASALEEFNYMSIILGNVISGSHLGREYAETQARELTNPDIPLGSNVIDKQLQLQSSSKFFIEFANELQEEVIKFTKYFRNLDKLSHMFPIGFFYDCVRVPLNAAVIPPDPLYFLIPWIVLQPNEKGDIHWRLSYPMNFYINQKNVFFDSEIPYFRLTSQVMLQYLFQVIRWEMISLNIDYSISLTSDKLSYSAHDLFKFEIETSSEKKMKKKSDVCPPYLPLLVSKCMDINPHPFEEFKEIIDERVLVKNAVDTVVSRFINSDFCDVKYVQQKRAVVIQITPMFGLVSSEIEKPKKKNYQTSQNQTNNKNDEKTPEKSPFNRIQSYNVTCYLAKNHFCATDPQSLYSYVNIDLRSRGANNSLTKWCESHYFRMFQMVVAAIASRFGYVSKMNDSHITVKCENERKIKIYTSGRGDFDVVVIHKNFKWTTKWNNLPTSRTLFKIEYLFFFNFTNK